MPAEQTWTVASALAWTRDYLADKNDEHPRLSAEWLLSAATGLSRVELYAYHDRPLAPEELAKLREGVKRRAQGEPLQYVTGEVAFRHLVLKVRPGVLIPRPETEVLVDVALPALQSALAERSRAVAIDLCTGTGCVALALAQECPGAQVVATDISAIAVEVARDNAQRLELADKVDVFEGDLAAPVPLALRGRVDLIVSNPPYIPSSDVPTLPAEVAGFEPHLALDGGPDGLDIYRRILADGRRWLRPGSGVIAVELDERRVRDAAAEATEWYEDVRVVADLTGRDRIVTARLPLQSADTSGQGMKEALTMTKVHHVDSENPNAEVINLAATVLRDGGLVVFPTETVYGIGALADSKFGAQEIFEVKVRPLDKPLPWLVENEDALDTYAVDVPEYAHRLAHSFWPGPLTLVVKASDRVGRDFRAADGTVALRSPRHEVVIELLQAAGGPIITTSANTSGSPAPGSFAEVEGRIVQAADLSLDGGETAHQQASTVVDATGPEPVVLREGAISAEQIKAAAAGN